MLSGGKKRMGARLQARQARRMDPAPAQHSHRTPRTPRPRRMASNPKIKSNISRKLLNENFLFWSEGKTPPVPKVVPLYHKSMITNKTKINYGSEGLRFDSSWLHFPSLCKPSLILPLRGFGFLKRYSCLFILCMFSASQLTPKLSPLKVVPV